jgi:hypothetical protein
VYPPTFSVAAQSGIAVAKAAAISITNFFISSRVLLRAAYSRIGTSGTEKMSRG